LNVAVGRAPLTVTAQPVAKSYGAALPPLPVAFAGFVNGDVASAIAAPPLASTAATTASGVGAYAITPAGGSDDNYAFTFVSGILTVAPAPLLIRAEDKRMTRGAAVPPLTVAISGFVLGDGVARLSSAPVATTTATGASPLGDYPITVAPVTAANYEVTTVAGTLTVASADGSGRSCGLGSGFSAMLGCLAMLMVRWRRHRH
jgi:hypothetical protein